MKVISYLKMHEIISQIVPLSKGVQKFFVH